MNKNRIYSLVIVSLLLSSFTSFIPSAHAVVATGGTITYSNGYVIHTFTSSGTFTVTTGGTVDYLVVGGGGGGGAGAGSGNGGGGAGAFRNGTGYAVTAQAYTITVGGGGTGGTGATSAVGTNGGNSIFDTITANGGGYGGTNAAAGNSANGSGGGGTAYVNPGGTGGTYGNNGGAGANTASCYGGGGGGGAGAVGGTGTGTTGGNGGIGKTSTISGTYTYYAGGGGGSLYSVGCTSGQGTGGQGGGGDAGTGSGTAGTANTGGGGGGARGGSGNNGGDGGSGIVIIRYLQQVPDAVTDLSYDNLSVNSVDLVWSQPNLNDGTLVNYLVNMTTPFGDPQTFKANSTNPYLNVTGLAFGTDYSARVSALTEGGYNATGNIVNFTTSSNTYDTPPTTLTVNDCYHTCTTQLNLEWLSGTMDNIVGYRIERESPVDGGFSVIVSNTTNTNTYYNNTGLTAGVFYNYKVYALNLTGISTASNEYFYSPHKLPNAVTDLVASTSTFVDVLLEWTEPTLYGTLSGYMINYTTPAGDPLTIITDNTESSSTSYTIVGLSTTEEYSFRVSPVTVHGTNGTGNIANATAVENFEIGNINLPTGSNTNTAEDITYTLTAINSTASTLTVQYPNDFDLACDFSYKFARNNQTYTGMTGTAVDATYDSTDFDFYGVDNEIIDVTCWDQNDSTNSADYLITQNSFPLLDQINNFRNGTYGTMGMFGVIDFITLAVIIFSMMGFNQVNEAVGVMFNIMLVGALAFFGIIELPTVVFGAIAVVVMFAITSTRKT